MSDARTSTGCQHQERGATCSSHTNMGLPSHYKQQGFSQVWRESTQMELGPSESPAAEDIILCPGEDRDGPTVSSSAWLAGCTAVTCRNAHSRPSSLSMMCGGQDPGATHTCATMVSSNRQHHGLVLRPARMCTVGTGHLQGHTGGQRQMRGRGRVLHRHQAQVGSEQAVEEEAALMGPCTFQPWPS